MSHEDDVGELVGIGQRVHLVEDVGCREAALKALFAGLTEEAVHLTAHLARHAECGAIVVGDVDRLHAFAVSCREEVFHGAVLGVLGIHGVGTTDLVGLAELLAIGLREIGHLVDASHAMLIEPLRHLSTGKGGHPKCACHALQLVGCHAEEGCLPVHLVAFFSFFPLFSRGSPAP